MSGGAWSALIAGAERLELEDGYALRLLSAQETLEAGREAEELARDGTERALCANACLVARALEREGERVYPHGRAALEGMTARQIGSLARKWAAFDRAENPSAGDGEQAEELKKSLGQAPDQRLRWRVLRTMGALPTEERVREMKERDYLWCALNLLLDEEERLDRLCPACRAEAMEGRCPVCGGLVTQGEGGHNQAFDEARFQALSRGEQV
ncbi:hypothetical protein [Pseudoflavonifractor sp. HCP28S3_F10]|uniref:hypothetical protein n=1 Tax=Pseudoflavonifractor sp. HCP28S3_F10 TaxID=3438947 RepID=UPI002A87B917|nr:hypothetical protein [Pseudoflavonifractor sp.]